jgi:hypothetical protein
MKCFQRVNVTSRTADFGQPKTYHRLKVGGFDQLKGDPIDEYEVASDEEKDGQMRTSEGD